jgi:hypothetical protein
LPPSYRTSRTLTLSRAVVSNRVVFFRLPSGDVGAAAKPLPLSAAAAAVRVGRSRLEDLDGAEALLVEAKARDEQRAARAAGPRPRERERATSTILTESRTPSIRCRNWKGSCAVRARRACWPYKGAVA